MYILNHNVLVILQSKKTGQTNNKLFLFVTETALDWITKLQYGNRSLYIRKTCPCNDSSSLTNEKDHHYFLNSADVCW